MSSLPIEVAIEQRTVSGNYSYHVVEYWKLLMDMRTGAEVKGVLFASLNSSQAQHVPSIDALLREQLGVGLTALGSALKGAGYDVLMGNTTDPLIKGHIKGLNFPASID